MNIKEPIRVLNLFTIMNRAGAETMAMNYYRNMDRSKVQFDFMVHREQRGDYDDEIESMGGKIYRMMPIYPQNFYAYKKQLKKFFCEHQEYKILHSNMSELGYFAFKEAAKHGKKTLICHAHNNPHGFDYKMIMRDYFKYRIKKYTTDMFVCGQSSGDWLFGRENRDKFIMMNNAIDTDKFIYNGEIRKKKRKELGIDANVTVIGHVGRLTKQKNHRFLFGIFKEILNKKNNSILLLVGTGELKKELEALAKQIGIYDKIIFCGSRTDVNELYQAMDVFVFPSLFEGFGIALLEAQAAGLPCVVSENIQKEVMVTDLIRKVSISEGAETWAEKIVSINNHERTNQRENLIKTNFDIKQNAKWLEEFYINEYNKNINGIYSGI